LRLSHVNFKVVFNPKYFFRKNYSGRSWRVLPSVCTLRWRGAQLITRARTCLHHLPRYIRCVRMCARGCVYARAVQLTHAHAPPDNRRADAPTRSRATLRACSGRTVRRWPSPRAPSTQRPMRRGGGGSACAWPRALSVESLNPTDHATLPPPNRAPPTRGVCSPNLAADL